jgi:hypothetical protein
MKKQYMLIKLTICLSLTATIKNSRVNDSNEILRKANESDMSLEQKVAQLQKQLDVYEKREFQKTSQTSSQKSTEFENSFNSSNAFGSSDLQVLKPIFNKKTKVKRNYAQCATSEEAYQSILAEKEIKRKKLEKANQIRRIKT